MAEAHHYATVVNRGSHGVVSEILDALAAARPAWWSDAMCPAYPEFDWFPDPVTGKPSPPPSRCAWTVQYADSAATLLEQLVRGSGYGVRC